MKQIYILTIALIAIGTSSNAQVGIGTSTPDAGSILDLTNSSEKLLLLPKPGIAAPSTFTTEGMLFYNADFLYYKKGTGFNVLSPWLFDGTATNGTYVPSGTRVGIGVATTVGENVNLKIANPGEAVTGGGSAAAIAIGNTTAGSNLLLDDDEILARNGTVADTLKMQEEGGKVTISGKSAQGTNTVLNVNGSINVMGTGVYKENGFDLVPAGTIVMWYGQFDGDYPMPGGVANTNWHICDGTNGTPNLSNAFVVASDMSVAGNSSPLANNGQSMTKSFSIAATNLPSHQHEAGSNGATMNITSSGTHAHIIDVNDTDGSGSSNVVEYDDATSDEGDINTHSDGAHTHPTGNFAGSTGNGIGLNGTAISVNITPAASRLAYIMKIN